MTYSSSLALSRQRFSGRGQNSTSFRATDRTLGPISNTIILIVLACLLGLLYLTQVTRANAFSYKIESLNKQQTQLQQEHDDLQVAAARLQSINRVSASAVNKKLVSIAPSATISN